ncbi:hypothetical protein GOODEAATRI_008334, partial [Goodea atripinnis]
VGSASSAGGGRLITTPVRPTVCSAKTILMQVGLAGQTANMVPMRALKLAHWTPPIHHARIMVILTIPTTIRVPELCPGRTPRHKRAHFHHSLSVQQLEDSQVQMCWAVLQPLVPPGLVVSTRLSKRSQIPAYLHPRGNKEERNTSETRRKGPEDVLHFSLQDLTLRQSDSVNPPATANYSPAVHHAHPIRWRCCCVPAESEQFADAGE